MEGGGRPAPRGAPNVWSPTRTPSPSRSPPKGREGEGRRGRGSRKGALAPFPCPIWTAKGGGGTRPAFGCPLLSPIRPMVAHLFPRIPVTPWYSEKYLNHSEPFRCPNIAFQYMNLYVSTISRLLVMSVISSGTPNKLWSSNHITL